MKTFLALLLIAGPAWAADDGMRNSAVKIFTTHQKADFYQPWQTNAQDNLSGSGVIIEGDRILTNAHVVSDQIFVQVRRPGDARKYEASVEYIAHDCELAILKVKDPAFYKGAKPVALGDLPHQRDKVAVYGFPAGGDDLSITEGIISRIEVIDYSHSSRRLLALQTDAAINPGNSGGPMMKDGKLVGVSFQSFSGTGVENIGYAVPVPIVRRFLRDIENGNYGHVPSVGLIWQNMENEGLRARYKLSPGQTGVLLSRVVYGSAAWGHLKEGDVLTAVDGVKIAADGTYLFSPDKRLSFTHLISLHLVDEAVPFDVLRDGKPLRVTIAMKASKEDIVGEPLYDQRPRYFIYGGIVFTPVTNNYIGQWPPNDVPTSLRYLRDYVLPSEDRIEAVVIAFILPNEVNAGYHEFRGIIIESVNGRKISKLGDLVEAFKHPIDGLQVIKEDEVTDFAGTIILDAAQASAANPEILAIHRIPSDRSIDLVETPPSTRTRGATK
jgi:S1-C subfamily serine protease